MHALLFHNPEAGDGNHARRTLLALLRKAGFSATYCSTKGPDFSDMLREHADLFVVAGGDGTVGKVLTWGAPMIVGEREAVTQLCRIEPE